MPITTDAVLKNLAELVAARGPGGQEEEVDAVCRRDKPRVTLLLPSHAQMWRIIR